MTSLLLEAIIEFQVCDRQVDVNSLSVHSK